MRQTGLPLSPVNPGPELPPAVFPDLTGIDIVQLDAETDGLKWVQRDRPIGWALGNERDGDRYFAFGHSVGNNCTREQWREWARRELRGKHIENHSTKFDIHMSRVDGVDLVEQGCTFHDVAHAAALLDDHRQDFGLNALGLDFLNEGKLEIGRKDDLASLPAGLVGAYACRDTKLVRDLVRVQKPLLAAEGLDRVQALENNVIPVVVEMEKNGMPLDLPLLERWERMSARILEKMQWELRRAAGFAVNVDSPKDLVRLAHTCGIKDEEFARTPSGQPSFTAAEMGRFAERAPAMLLAFRIGKVKDLRSKYLVKYSSEHVGGILYPRLWQIMTDEGGTVSGRFSCTAPNAQQILSADKHLRVYAWLREYALRYCDDATKSDDFLIKRLFVPRHGASWLSSDARQIEFRLFSHYAQSRAILDRYRAAPSQEVIGSKHVWTSGPEADFHSIVSKIIMQGRADVTRTEVKQCNFAKVYGGGPGTIARTLGIEMGAARELSASYDEQFPEAKILGDRCSRTAESRGYVFTLLGRRSRFPVVPTRVKDWHTGGTKEVMKRDRTHKALNCVLQGGGADINKLKLVELYQERQALGVTMRLTVHDSIEGDIDDAALAPKVRTLLDNQTTPLSVDILWDVNTGATWADAK